MCFIDAWIYLMYLHRSMSSNVAAWKYATAENTWRCPTYFFQPIVLLKCSVLNSGSGTTI